MVRMREHQSWKATLLFIMKAYELTVLNLFGFSMSSHLMYLVFQSGLASLCASTVLLENYLGRPNHELWRCLMISVALSFACSLTGWLLLLVPPVVFASLVQVYVRWLLVILPVVCCSGSRCVSVRHSDAVSPASQKSGVTFLLEHFCFFCYFNYFFGIFIIPFFGRQYMQPGFVSKVYGYDSLFDYIHFPRTLPNWVQLLPVVSTWTTWVPPVFFLAQSLLSSNRPAQVAGYFQVTAFYGLMMLVAASNPQSLGTDFWIMIIGHIGAIFNWCSVSFVTFSQFIRSKKYSWITSSLSVIYLVLFFIIVTLRSLLEVNEAAECSLCAYCCDPTKWVRSTLGNVLRWAYLLCSPIIPGVKAIYMLAAKQSQGILVTPSY